MSALLAIALLQLKITVTAPESITVRRPATITVEATAEGRVAPVIRPPSFGSLSAIRASQTTQMDANGFAWSVRVQQSYVIIAPKAGPVVIPPFEAHLRRTSTRSRAIRLLAVNAAPAQTPTIVQRAPLDASQPVNFHAMAGPDTVYVGQQATYAVGVFLSDDIRLRLRHNPQFVPPELRSMLSYDLVAPGPLVARREIKGQRYDTHVFQRAIFPLTAGTYVIPPARLDYSLPLTASFFSREESHTVKSESVTVVAVEPPQQGRPTDYRGAVGDIKLETFLDANKARVGDPLVVTVRVNGTGNVNFFPRPELAIDWGRTVRADERVRLDSTKQLLSGSKEFDYLVTPQRSGRLDVPAIRYPYFNPYTERYEIAVTPAQAVEIAPGTLTALDSVRADSVVALAIQPTIGAATRDPISSSPYFWLTVAIAPLPAMALAVRRRPRVVAARPPHEQLRAVARDGAKSAPAQLRHAFAGAIAARVAATPAALSNRDVLRRVLRRAGVSAEGASEVDEVLVALDRAVYSPDTALATNVKERARRAYALVDQEAKPLPAAPPPRITPRSTPTPGGRAFLLLLALGAVAASTSASAQDSTVTVTPERAAGTTRRIDYEPSAESLFASGKRAYEARAYRSAERLFAGAAAAAPNRAAAWENFGTAAWMAGDTAAAAVGWHRALRLDPFASEIRDRLTATPGFDPSATGTVPLASETLIAIVGLAAWLVACGAAALAFRRGARRVPPLAWTAGALAFVAFVAGVGVHSIATGSKQSVVTRAGILRALPALGADPGANVLTGELTRTVAKQGAWSHVRTRDGRDGWIESERLQSLSGALHP